MVPKTVVKQDEFQGCLWKDKELKDVVCRSNVDDNVFTPYGSVYLSISLTCMSNSEEAEISHVPI